MSPGSRAAANVLGRYAHDTSRNCRHLAVLHCAGTAQALSFYDRLGFEIVFTGFSNDLFFGIVSRGGATIMFKDVGVDPLPNYRREPAARWDAYLYVPDPDALADEFAARNVEFSEPLKDTHDGLRGFELKDADGYVLFFGRPRA